MTVTSPAKDLIQQTKTEVEQQLDEWLPAASQRPRRLHEAMRHSVFAGGKRLRPCLCLAAAEALNGRRDIAMRPACALEILHTYTLIHDDLPAMDDDDTRRGQPTLHRAFDEATAILAGDALLTKAFEWVAQTPVPPPHTAGDAVRTLAEAAGSEGIIGGQVEDIEAEGQPPDTDRLQYIHEHKTARLIQGACALGGISAGADADQVAALKAYGRNIGLAFQIMDDILDETATSEDWGKPVGSDRERQKATYVALYGLDEARKQADALLAEVPHHLKQAGASPEGSLHGLAQFVVGRDH